MGLIKKGLKRNGSTKPRMGRIKRKGVGGRSNIASKPKKQKTMGKLLKKADTLFSLKIRARDRKCLHPRCKCKGSQLQCSHFIGRAHKATRFDFDNCMTLSWYCHFKNKRIGFEYQKQTIEEDGHDGEYTKFMKNWLGKERYEQLMARSKESLKLTRPYLENLILELSK